MKGPGQRSRHSLLVPYGRTVLLGGALLLAVPAQAVAESRAVILEDFGSQNQQGFPLGWEAQRNITRAQQAYTIRTSEDGPFLAAEQADQRVFKRIAWDPKAMPMVTWKWRLKAAPPKDSDPIAAVFVSLDTDLFFIPVATKYVWSLTKAEGTSIEGGLFGASEIVVQTGPQPVGEWIHERVNAYADFKRLHRHEPAEEAWGVSLLAGPGVEIDFGPIAVSAP